jgi:SAM-dependent methyltransferase
MHGYRVCSDVQFRIEGEGVLASNYRARRHLWLSLPLFNTLVGSNAEGELRIANLTRFTNVDGLMANPMCRDLKSMAETTLFSSVDEALDYLAKHFIVIQDDANYDAFFQKKRSILDRDHFGTFHQQLGVELRLRLRKDPAIWWNEQKFHPSTGEVRENLYKFVQEAFLDRYIASLDLQGKFVLDFGCGNGIAARRFVARGAVVIGIDPDENLLEEAVRTIGDGFEPIVMRLSDPDPLAILPQRPLDVVWLSDVLMFYFYPQDAGEAWISPAQLLSRLTSNLRPLGRCVIMQPHGVFWLAPWLGDPGRPYTVITEYATRLYSVTPSLEELCKAVRDAGLAVRCIYEPKPEVSGGTTDIRAFNFATVFPQWWAFECIKVGSFS